MYNPYTSVVPKVKNTPSVWACKVLLLLTFVGAKISYLQQLYDSFFISAYNPSGAFPSGGAIALVVFIGAAAALILYAIYAAMVRVAFASFYRSMAVLQQPLPDARKFRTAYDVTFICANLIVTALEILTVFFPTQMIGTAALINVIVKVIALVSVTLLIVKKTGRQNASFLMSSVAGFYAVALLLL